MRSVLHDGIGVVSGGSASGFMSTLSKDDNLVLSSEDSSTPDESELELGLGLSLGGGCGVISEGLVKTQKGSRGQYARILTAKDFSSASYSTSSSALSSVASSSSSSSSMNKANVSAGTKRSADSVAAANGASQVVGWPPIRTYRMQSLVNSAKLPTSEYSFDEKSRCLNSMTDKNGNDKGQGHLRKNLFVKVNMDGIAIGRKVDLSAHNGYEALARTLEDMFYGSNRAASSLRMSGAATGHSRLLDGSFDFVLTYEDKDGDWMLVGDVPWGMFLDSVKRLRIMRTSEANGLSPRIQERNGSSRQPMLKR